MSSTFQLCDRVIHPASNVLAFYKGGVWPLGGFLLA